MRARLDALARQQGGRIFSTAGDGFMLEFPLAIGAVRAATTLLREAAKPGSELPRVRAGAHLGEVLVAGDDLLGHGVNVAARLSALAEPNGLVVSETLKAQLRGEVDVAFTPMGEVRLSKMRETVEAYAYVAAASHLPPWARRARDFMRRHRRAVAAVSVAAAGTLAAAAWLATRTVDYAVERIDPIIQSELDETQPVLTPDGRYLVYAVDVGPERNIDYDLFMRHLASGESTRLTATPDFFEYSPAVSPSGDRLAYIMNDGRRMRRGEFEPCQIMLRSFPDGLDRQVGACEVLGGVARLTWTPDGRGLVYSDLVQGEEAREGPFRIRLLEVETGQSRDLVPPLQQGWGDHNATVSPDGRRVAFARYSSQGAGDI